MKFRTQPSRSALLPVRRRSVWMGIVFGILAVSGVGVAQGQIPAHPCTSFVRGRVQDRNGKEPLVGVVVYVQELQRGVATDAGGNYQLEQICPGTYTLVCSYVGYVADTMRIELKEGRLTQNFSLREEQVELAEVTVTEHRAAAPLVSQAIHTLEGRGLQETRGLNLAQSLQSIPGVYTISTGPTIAKPVIHGLYSNRILILNNGVRLEGQQWGSEHAPEIDPFVATRMSIIKGAASIRYGSDAIGGVIMVEPATLPTQKSLSGEINLVGASNGRMGTTSGILQGAFDKKLTGLSWRVQGTYRRGGNVKAPDYYLGNTGLREANFSTQLAYRRKNYGAEVYFSYFDTKLGIYDGAHGQTTTEIKEAVELSRPAVNYQFGYTIARPFQQVTHTLLKASAFISGRLGRLDATFARQQNDRSEYDYTPLNNSQDPELYLQITTHTLDLVWTHPARRNLSGMSGSMGFNGITQGNYREYAYLIPNFRNYGGGLFWIEKWQRNRLALEGGLRYDYRWLRVYKNTKDDVNKIITPTYQYNRLSGTLGALYNLTEKLSISGNASTAWRAPTVNELYSEGVHQSAGRYEVGDSTLGSTPEKAFNLSVSANYSGKKLAAELTLYQNTINHYIYLKPADRYIQDIRGAYLLFNYAAADVVFRGIDASLSYKLTDKWTLTSKGSLIWSYNYTAHDYLIYTPPNRLENGLRYDVGAVGKLREVYLGVTNLNMARQTRVPANSDFIPPPAGYVLFGANAGFTWPVGNQKIEVSLGVTNLLNRSYRDYLNSFRYYTNEMGQNFTLRVRVPFDLSGKSS